MINEDLWSELESSCEPPVHGRIQRRIHPESPNDILAAMSYPGRQRMLVVSAPSSLFPNAVRLLRDLREVRGLAVDVEVVDRSRSELRIAVTSRDLESVFTPLARDIADAVAASPSDGVILETVQRYAHWQELLRSVGPDGLGLETRRGLFGELHVLREHLLPNMTSALDAVRAWTGPTGTDQDFQLPSCAVEVKTTKRRSPATVTITSERQLEDYGAGDLFLTAIVVDERRGGTGVSLPSMVGDIRESISDSRARAELDLNLARYGYFDHDVARYDEPRYTVVTDEVWRVTNDFPRLTTAILPPGVHRCTYEISADFLTQFAMTRDAFTAALRRCHQ